VDIIPREYFTVHKEGNETFYIYSGKCFSYNHAFFVTRFHGLLATRTLIRLVVLKYKICEQFFFTNSHSALSTIINKEGCSI
jgi:hypothetical protein